VTKEVCSKIVSHFLNALVLSGTQNNMASIPVVNTDLNIYLDIQHAIRRTAENRTTFQADDKIRLPGKTLKSAIESKEDCVIISKINLWCF